MSLRTVSRSICCSALKPKSMIPPRTSRAGYRSIQALLIGCTVPGFGLYCDTIVLACGTDAVVQLGSGRNHENHAGRALAPLRRPDGARACADAGSTAD